MKKLKIYFKPVFILLFAIVFISCKNNKTEPQVLDEPMTDDTTSVVSAFEPFDVMAVKLKVANYDKWKPSYDQHDSVRKVYGMSNYMIGRGIDDMNTLLVINKFSDIQKAKEFSALPNLKEAMTKGGIIGKPEFGYYHVIRIDESVIDQKDRVMVTHKVKDFDAWLKVFDAEGTAKRMEEGLIDRGLARGIDDPNMVSIVFAVSDMKKAKEAITSDAKKKVMMDAGVEGVPKIFFYKIMD